MSAVRRMVVFGATGAQGGSVARCLLDRGRFAVRCVTRHPDSDRADALRRQGAEIVRGDLADPDSLRAALDGCWGVFGVTNFWEHFGSESQQGRNLVDAVVAAKVAHFVFSTLPSYRALSGGKLEVPHCDIKAELETYTCDKGLPATFAHVAFYYENFLTYFPPQRQPDGSFAFGFPQGDTPLAGVSVDDVGAVVAAVFEQPDRYRGRVVGIVGDDLPGQKYAEIMSSVLGVDIRYHHVPHEVFAAFGFPGAQELANMFEVQRLHVPGRAADLAESRQLHPQIQTFADWLGRHAEAFAPILRPQAALS